MVPVGMPGTRLGNRLKPSAIEWEPVTDDPYLPDDASDGVGSEVTAEIRREVKRLHQNGHVPKKVLKNALRFARASPHALWDH